MKHLVLIIFLVSSCLSFSQKKEKHGIFEEHYKSGELKTSGQYREGKKSGQWLNFYESGQLSRIYTYNSKGGETGLSESYFENGNLKTKTSKLKNGSYLTRGYYEDNGNLFYEMVVAKQSAKSSYFLNNGFYKEYHKNQVLKVECNYVNHQTSGLWKQFYESGEKEWEVIYFNGYKQGVYRQYYRNGALKLEGEHLADLKNGEEKRYDENENLLWKGNYLKNDLDGFWIKYDSNRNEEEKIKFKKGKVKGSNKNIILKPTKIPEGTFEKVPVYPGCEKMLGYKAQRKCMSNSISVFITKNFNTSFASGLGLEGRQRINVIFKISKTGEIIDIRARAPHPDLKAEAVRVINKLPKMKPGRQRGRPVIVPYSLPIVFMVQPKKKKDPFDDPFSQKTRN